MTAMLLPSNMRKRDRLVCSECFLDATDRAADAAPEALMLAVTPWDIEFESIRSNRIAIDIRVSNPHRVATLPVRAQIASAPFGAFLDWSPLALDMRIPALPPGGEHTVSLTAAAPAVERARTLPAMHRLTPSHLRTALDMHDAVRPLVPTVATDILDVIGMRSAHWVGNVNILMQGHCGTERHLARALRLHAGERNVAMFMVGSHTDDYAFSMTGSGLDWQPRLKLVAEAQTFQECVMENNALVERHYITLPPRSVVLLEMDPPAEVRDGMVIVGVTKRSTGESTQVEFSLDVNAAGAGCYVV